MDINAVELKHSSENENYSGSDMSEMNKISISREDNNPVDVKFPSVAIKKEVPDETEVLQNFDDDSITLSQLKSELGVNDENGVKIKIESSDTYTCNICSEVFVNYASLREHRKVHFIEKRTCDICGIVCKSIGKLEVHVNAHLGIKPCVCGECGKSYSSSTQLKIHKRIHTDEKRYKCQQCDQAFRYNGTLKSHIRLSHTKIMENTCKVCSKYCESPEELKKHKATVHAKTKQAFNCQLCDKVFKTEQLLSCHLKVHTELKFPCEFCQRIYPSLYRLKKHVGRAHIPNICECKKVFYDRSEFTKHNKEFHKAEESTVCQYCNKEFDKVKNLTEHIRLQHKGNGKVNKCDICEKEFINASLLRNHIKIHDKSFKCEYCDKIFGSRYNLQIHLVVHTKERKYKCEKCGNYYGTKTALKNHEYTHLEVRNYICEICSKAFKSNHRLYAHKSLHETEKKFECEICHARFTIKQYLNFHMKKHSNVKPFECKPCQRRFKHKRSFDKHCLLERHRRAVEKLGMEYQSDDYEKEDDIPMNEDDVAENQEEVSSNPGDQRMEKVKIETRIKQEIEESELS